jgi:hypothetical protein
MIVNFPPEFSSVLKSKEIFNIVDKGNQTLEMKIELPDIEDDND